MDNIINYDSVDLPEGYDIQEPEGIEWFRSETEVYGSFALMDDEIWWRDHYDALLSHGYKLRPRFHPDWRPSWLGTSKLPYACEDSIRHIGFKVIDAKRLKDGKIVALKQVKRGSPEIHIAKTLSSPERLRDSSNHCVPILDHFRLESEAIDFLVMPLLLPFNGPPFFYVAEVVDFVRQTLEGLVYIHDNNVAHRDLSDGNIMVDARRLFDARGFHPSTPDVTAQDVRVDVIHKSRMEGGPVKYYFTDFGESSYFEDPTEERLVLGKIAQDEDVPELSLVWPYDPFPVDVFTLGMVYKRNFQSKYTNLGFLEPLVDAMTQLQPSSRPKARQAMQIFEDIESKLRGPKLRWRLRSANDPMGTRVANDVLSSLRELKVLLLSPVTAAVLVPITIATLLTLPGPRKILSRIRSIFGRQGD